jgi:5-carboxyvanillate decarboxylase
MESEVDYLRIATEEAFAPPELIALWQSMLADGTCDDPGFVSLHGFYLRSKAERPAAVLARLQDLGERRIADMDAAGIDRQIISLTSPGTQILDRDRAVAMATLANDQLAEACRRHPGRFSGLTAIAPQDASGAAKEMERGKNELGLKGVIVNSHTQGEYLDDPKFWPIFEAAEALDAPIYLHPNTPPRSMIGPTHPRRSPPKISCRSALPPRRHFSRTSPSRSSACKPTGPVTPRAACRGCGTTRSSSAPRPGPWRARPQSS